MKTDELKQRGGTTMKCNDCGKRDYKPSDRSDVCVDCLELRGKLLDAVRTGHCSMDEFKELQRTISSGNGRAADYIRSTLGIADLDESEPCTVEEVRE